MKSRPSDDDLKELNANLSRGLETCRSMVANYRDMLVGEHAWADNDEIDDLDDAERA